jgi:hypothetical protein
MPKIVDPDNLTTGTSVFWTTGSILTRTIGVSSSADSVGSLIPPLESGSDSGVTFQCLYSFAKEEWKSSDTLIRIPFPFISITKTQFDVINQWDFYDDSSRYLIRDGGWSVISSSATGDITTQEWVNIRTLGSIGFDTTTIPPDPALSDQVYYVQSGSETISPIKALEIQDFKMSGSVNQAIQQYSASKATGTLVVGYNFRGSTDLYVREYKKIYDSANLQTDLGIETQEYTQLSVPLQNSTDLKINTATEGQAASEGPWRYIDIYFFSGSGFIASGSDGNPSFAGLVVSGSDGNWYIDNDGTSTGSPPGNGWAPYALVTSEGTVISASAQILADQTYTIFNKIITNGTGSAINAQGEGTGSTQDVYTSVQYQLRQEINIDKAEHFPTSNPITYLGKRTDSLLSFVGDTLVTSNGVYVFPLKNADTNAVDFYDVSGSVVRFPFVSTGTLQFDANIQADFSASYFMFFTNLGNEGGDSTGSFGLPDAVIVNDNDGDPITGSLRDNGGLPTASVSFTFDYDGNTQGGRTAGSAETPSNAGVTVVAIGLASAAYVTVTSTILRTKTNNISLVAALERNYENPA